MLGSWRAVQGPRVRAVMDIVVENLGRVNYGRPHDFNQKKGLWEGPVLLDGHQLSNWIIIPLEFKRKWVNGLRGWKAYQNGLSGPVAVRLSLTVNNPQDTFLDMSSWGKGVVFVNGFNLGRYWSTVGPQQTLYLPGPLLRIGTNTVIIFQITISVIFNDPLIDHFRSSFTNSTRPPLGCHSQTNQSSDYLQPKSNSLQIDETSYLIRIDLKKTSVLFSPLVNK